MERVMLGFVSPLITYSRKAEIAITNTNINSVEQFMQRCIFGSIGFNVCLVHYNAIWRLFTSSTLLFFVGRFVMILKEIINIPVLPLAKDLS